MAKKINRSKIYPPRRQPPREEWSVWPWKNSKTLQNDWTIKWLDGEGFCRKYFSITDLQCLVLKLGPVVVKVSGSEPDLVSGEVSIIHHLLSSLAHGSHAVLVVVDLCEHCLVLLHQVLHTDQVSTCSQLHSHLPSGCHQTTSAGLSFFYDRLKSLLQNKMKMVKRKAIKHI